MEVTPTFFPVRRQDVLRHLAVMPDNLPQRDRINYQKDNFILLQLSNVLWQPYAWIVKSGYTVFLTKSIHKTGICEMFFYTNSTKYSD